MTSETPMSWRCFFCGQELLPKESKDQFRCPGCKATFQGTRDPEGCLIEMKVINCGTSDCCQDSPKDPEGSCGSCS